MSELIINTSRREIAAAAPVSDVPLACPVYRFLGPGPAVADGDHGTKSKLTGTLWVGIDVGSTTAKIAVIDPENKTLLHWKYRRHLGRQAQTVAGLLSEAHDRFPLASFAAGVCGSGSEPIADVVGGIFVQEVIANSIAVSELFPGARTSIELGGQDAKILFFREDGPSRRLRLSDMRMNGRCAGGTGAFIDQMAVLLGVPIEQFDAMAGRGKNVFDISGRCGVFAKTDLQPLLNMGVPREDIVLSVFHAVARQTITGLGHGTRLQGPVVFSGGPFTFNPELVRVFAQHIGLAPEEVLVPARSQVAVAMGAAFSLGVVRSGVRNGYCGRNAIRRLAEPGRLAVTLSTGEPFFRTNRDMADFYRRHYCEPFVPVFPPAGTTESVYIGIDAGSTTVKFVLIDENAAVINMFYAPNAGDPLTVVKNALIGIHDVYREKGVRLDVSGVGATGYGESFIAAALGADVHTVETIAHARAALHFVPEATFVLDIGGQDMKAMRIHDGVICDLYLNEACSAGCGSFIETLAASLGVPVTAVAGMAFAAKRPSTLGSRCTVFMNSSITNEQKNGKSVEDIMAGLCRSVIENLFTKVIRDRSAVHLGSTIVVQGGTFKNDAVLRAFEQRTGARVIRPRFAGEMGALGIALLTKESMVAAPEAPRTSFIGFEALRMFECSGVVHDTCAGCSNACKRTIVRFSTGAVFCAGNRCEKGNIHSNAGARPLTAGAPDKCETPSLVRFREAALLRDYVPAINPDECRTTVGIPRILEFYHSLPFWKALFSALGFAVVVSPRSTQKIADRGMRYVASDNVCFPAKIAHGHLEWLLEKGVDRIFMPQMVATPAGGLQGDTVHMCPVVQGYPMVLREMNEPLRRASVAVDMPVFIWHDSSKRRRQVQAFLRGEYRIDRRRAARAVAAAEKAQAEFERSMVEEGRRVLAGIESAGTPGVILAGRPYHYDPHINHGVPEIFSSLGIPLLTADALPGLARLDLRRTRPEPYNPFHTAVLAAGLFAAAHPCLEVVQLVSFGCGHDAILADELARIMGETSGRQPLVLKIDEGEALGALRIRIRSFVETLRRRRG